MKEIHIQRVILKKKINRMYPMLPTKENILKNLKDERFMMFIFPKY